MSDKKLKHIRSFLQHIEQWKYQEVTQFTWYPSINGMQQRKLELWLCEEGKHLEPTRLKLIFHLVDERAYNTIYFTGVKLDVRLGEQGQYVFLDSHDYSRVLLECEDFEFYEEQIEFDEL